MLANEDSGYVLCLGPRLERGGHRTTASHQSRGHKATTLIPRVKPKPPQSFAIRHSALRALDVAAGHQLHPRQPTGRQAWHPTEHQTGNPKAPNPMLV